MAKGRENLIVPTSEQARINGAKGGRKSAENKKKRKAMREQLEMLLSLPLQNDKVKAEFEKMGIDSDNLDNQMALIIKTYSQAMKGNIQAVNVIREIIGERTLEVNVNRNVDEKVKELDGLLNEYGKE